MIVYENSYFDDKTRSLIHFYISDNSAHPIRDDSWQALAVYPEFFSTNSKVLANYGSYHDPSYGLSFHDSYLHNCKLFDSLDEFFDFCFTVACERNFSHGFLSYNDGVTIHSDIHRVPVTDIYGVSSVGVATSMWYDIYTTFSFVPRPPLSLIHI